jgi:hypothetical protein
MAKPFEEGCGSLFLLGILGLTGFNNSGFLEF